MVYTSPTLEDFNFVRNGEFLKLSFPSGNIGTSIWERKKTFYKEIGTQYVNIGEPNNIIQLDYSKLQTISVANIGEFTDYVELLLTERTINNLVATTEVISDISDGNLMRIANDAILDVARGIVSDKSVVTVIGSNPSIGVTAEDIWCYGGDYNFLSTATTLEVSSNNIEDGVTGLGARQLIINGLDENYNAISEIVSLVGNDVSIGTTYSYLRLIDATVIDVGTTRGSNYNDLNIQESGGGNVIGSISGGYGTINTSNYGLGRTQLGLYTVPAGKSAYFLAVTLIVSGGATADISINMYNNAIPSKPRMTLFELRDHRGIFEKRVENYFKITEKTDIWYRAKTNSGTASVEVAILLLLIDD